MIKWILLLTTCALAQQTYDNVGLNSHFEVPAGWAMEKPDTLWFGVHIQVTRVGLKPVNIYLEKNGSSLEAHLDRQAYGFFKMADFYNRCASSTVAPITPFLLDSTYNSGISISGFTIRHVALDKHLACYASSFKTYTHKFCYETTMNDFDTNRDLYIKNWLGVSFINLSTTAAKLAAPLTSQAQDKQGFVDVLGRKAGSSSLRIPQILAPNR